MNVAVAQLRARTDRVQLVELDPDVRQGREPLHRLGEPAREHPRAFHRQRLRLDQREARRGRDRVPLDEEVAPVVQRAERNRAQRLVGDEHERLDAGFLEQRLDRPDDPVVDPARVRQVLVGRPLLEQRAQLQRLAPQGRLVDVRLLEQALVI